MRRLPEYFEWFKFSCDYAFSLTVPGGVHHPTREMQHIKPVKYTHTRSISLFILVLQLNRSNMKDNSGLTSKMELKVFRIFRIAQRRLILHVST